MASNLLLTDEFENNIIFDTTCKTVEEAICLAGQLLVKNKYARPEYIEGMLAREAEHSTYIGFGVMIPHGTQQVLPYVESSGLSIVILPHGIPYHGETVTMVIGIAGEEDVSLQELMQITDILVKPDKRERLLHTSSKQEFIKLINENYIEEGEI
jgi:mannitol/fructose-specific phosphotransferase system IIA component